MSVHHRQRHLTRQQVAIAVQRLGGECSKCGSRAHLEVHHKRPLADGGTNRLENLALLCRNCHIALHRAERQTPGREDWLELVGVGGRHRRG